MAQIKPIRKWEVTYIPKNQKFHYTEYVDAQSESHARCLVRATEGMVKFIEIKLAESEVL